MIDLLNSMNNAYKALQDVQQRQNQDAVNGSRPASSTFTARAKGAGTTIMQKPLLFSNYFTDLPSFTSGSALVATLDAKKFLPPQCDSGVYRWITAPFAKVFGNGVTGLPDLDDLLSQGTETDTTSSTDSTKTTADGYLSTPANGALADTVYLGVYMWMRVKLFDIKGKELTFKSSIPDTLAVDFHFTFGGVGTKMTDRKNIHGPLASSSSLDTLKPPVMVVASGGS